MKALMLIIGMLLGLALAKSHDDRPQPLIEDTTRHGLVKASLPLVGDVDGNPLQTCSPIDPIPDGPGFDIGELPQPGEIA